MQIRYLDLRLSLDCSIPFTGELNTLQSMKWTSLDWLDSIGFGTGSAVSTRSCVRKIICWGRECCCLVGCIGIKMFFWSDSQS